MANECCVRSLIQAAKWFESRVYWTGGEGDSDHQINHDLASHAGDLREMAKEIMEGTKGGFYDIYSK